MVTRGDSMRSASRRAGIIAAAVALAMSAAGCTALTPSGREATTPAAAPTSPTQQSLDGGCDTVNAEWGFALDPWVALEADTQSRDFEQKRPAFEKLWPLKAADFQEQTVEFEVIYSYENVISEKKV